jgi:hypothetical protein
MSTGKSSNDPRLISSSSDDRLAPWDSLQPPGSVPIVEQPLEPQGKAQTVGMVVDPLMLDPSPSS